MINGDYLYSAVLKSSSMADTGSGFVTILDKDFKVVSNLAGSDPVYKDGKPVEMVKPIMYFSIRMTFVLTMIKICMLPNGIQGMSIHTN